MRACKVQGTWCRMHVKQKSTQVTRACKAKGMSGTGACKAQAIEICRALSAQEHRGHVIQQTCNKVLPEHPKHTSQYCGDTKTSQIKKNAVSNNFFYG